MTEKMLPLDTISENYSVRLFDPAMLSGDQLIKSFALRRITLSTFFSTGIYNSRIHKSATHNALSPQIINGANFIFFRYAYLP